MRERFSGKIIQLLEEHSSAFYRRIQIQVLMTATAKAFRKRGRCLLFSHNPLAEYAKTTKAYLGEGDFDPERLYGLMFRLGRRIRRLVGFTAPEDCQRLVFLLYRYIGIRMTGTIPGDIRISKCYFSPIYTAKECRMISAMDAGLVAGICGGRLSFCQRITEGCDQCKASVLPMSYR